jgi:DNA-binding HxlR family transcriptional regulator
MTLANFEAAAAIIGKRWTPQILNALTEGPQRFGQLRDACPGIGSRILSARLRELEQDGIVTRTVYDEIPQRVEYRLTARGRGLVPAIAALRRWR